MQKYDGAVIHRTHDDDGIVEVVQNGMTLSMHFGTTARQSCMSLVDPDRLELPYIRAMMSCLLFKSDPQTILIIGLGGGSLAKFLLRQFTHCRIQVVESRPSVTRVAYAYFRLPEDPRVSIRIGDGCRFVTEATGKSEFDLILVDAYDDKGMAHSINRPVFFDSCAQLVSPDGVLSMNLWGNQRDVLDQSMDQLNQSFGHRVLNLPVKGRANIIGLGLSNGIERMPLKALQQRADQLALHLGLDMPSFLRQIKRHNRSAMKRLLI